MNNNEQPLADLTLEEIIQERAGYIRKYFDSIGMSHLIDENCHCGHKRSEHTDTLFNYDGHGRCLRCSCEQFTYKSFIEAPPVPRLAFFVMKTQMNSQGEYNALIAVENESGYYRTDWFWGKDFKIAQEIADERNARMGLTKKEAAMIQLSTMREPKLTPSNCTLKKCPYNPISPGENSQECIACEGNVDGKTEVR